MGRAKPVAGQVDDNPLWYQDVILYEVHVRAFYDQNGDGIGDFRGLAAKLDYLQDLGIGAIWLLPFYPSPLKDDGYDIADFTGVHPDYGTRADFRHFVREAHSRGLRVVTELVCNHTSDQHPWFQRARRAQPGTVARNFYVWSETSDRYKDARIIFKDFETSNWTWDPMARAHFWHRFYSHQPDLNYELPQVRRALMRVVDQWLDMGVDGLRLDAVPYLFEQEGTSCENLPPTHAFLKELRRHVDERYRGRMLLAEANQWPEDAVAYFGAGDECHMAFHFPVMPRLFMAMSMEDRFPITDIMAQTPAIPAGAQWALFLRNHDELTLEMVSDEERDYMYRVYAHDPRARINLGIRRRLAPLLGTNRRRIELMHGLLFALPGTPVIYYGDEIGMGDNIYLGDRNGVRTPMQWSPDRNAGFSTANSQRLYLPVVVDPEYHYEAVNVAAQMGNPQSLLLWMRRLITLRQRYRAFGRGSLEFLHPNNRRILAFIRQYENERILVVANLSRYVQYVELDLSGYRDLIPVELFGRQEFPPVGRQPYLLTLGPHSFYWFALEPRPARAQRAAVVSPEAELPVLVAEDWESVLSGRNQAAVAETLAGSLASRRWFGGKGRVIKSASILESVPVPYDGNLVHLVMLQVDFTEGVSQVYALPLAHTTGDWATELRSRLPEAVIAEFVLGDRPGLLYDALSDPGFGQVLLQAIERRRRYRGEQGSLTAYSTVAFRTLRGVGELPLDATLARIDQSNSSVLFGDRLILKLFRRVEEGANPDVEISRFLTEKAGYGHTAVVAGGLEYVRETGESITLGILHGFVPNQGDAWQMTQGALRGYYERVAGQGAKPPELAPPSSATLLEMAGQEPPDLVRELIGSYLEATALLGRRTAELHLALAAAPDDPAFAPEPFTSHYQRALYHAMRSTATQTLAALRQGIKGLPPPLQPAAHQVLRREGEVMNRLARVLEVKVHALRIRCHGDYHLGQVLYTGHDFVIIDFEGEPDRPLRERRLKRLPLRDVAGMLRSFHYAASLAMHNLATRNGEGSSVQATGLEGWARLWYCWVAAGFLQGYLAVAGKAPFLPRGRRESAVLLDAYLLDKALYELSYELSTHPAWAAIPLQGILEVLATREAT